MTLIGVIITQAGQSVMKKLPHRTEPVLIFGS